MTSTPHPCGPCLSRRTVIAAAVGGLSTALAGCASYGDAPAAAPAAAPSGTGAAAPAARLAALADIPVGGGIVLADQKVVLTQPTEGTVAAFSATCTHAGCAVNEVSNGLIRCPCHGSAFDITSGAPTAGPAGSPLPAVAVVITGTDVVLA